MLLDPLVQALRRQAAGNSEADLKPSGFGPLLTGQDPERL